MVYNRRGKERDPTAQHRCTWIFLRPPTLRAAVTPLITIARRALFFSFGSGSRGACHRALSLMDNNSTYAIHTGPHEAQQKNNHRSFIRVVAQSYTSARTPGWMKVILRVKFSFRHFRLTRSQWQGKKNLAISSAGTSFWMNKFPAAAERWNYENGVHLHDGCATDVNDVWDAEANRTAPDVM